MTRKTLYGTLAQDEELNENEKAMLYIKECAELVGLEVIEGKTAFSIIFMAEIMRRLRKKQAPCDDVISRQAAQAKIKSICNEYRLSYEDGEKKVATGGSAYALGHAFDDLPPVTPQPKAGICKDCKWWKDSDGLYRRGSHAESQCPINRREVLEGNGYCYMFEPREERNKE